MKFNYYVQSDVDLFPVKQRKHFVQVNRVEKQEESGQHSRNMNGNKKTTRIKYEIYIIRSKRRLLGMGHVTTLKIMFSVDLK